MLKYFSLIIVILSFFSINANAQEKNIPFTGVFEGHGRVCYGHLYIKTKTIEWISSFAVCKRSTYKILEMQFDDKGKRIVYLIKNPSKYCRIKIIEFYKEPMDSEDSVFEHWTLTGYKSVEEYHRQKDTKQTSEENFDCDMVR
ncbi:unnamed protein product [Commensalibacter communis]|uniref:Uncharacterized protein n=1 Tax=Commensalibacter communis TaxID=2972786 RepID=A0A9W4X7H5_9PROT|nr:hypothetical protein [Commensalibacter communis]CAI3956383.1 unnamed protein product [Commensalibacter communis]CAI3958353.1 unnamed protein product [Commensalibacter communis]CAI3958731.1 unnamed protein product [Commensalibacter communis]CAI3959454.1 unnamed protein product [Commensalibacter communis]CAI3959922.1 unnamed protein product [Commensalibacter communis]